ncbi:MAG TPA: malto-oligosyltrehalose trehalohydrolase [Thermomicrobiales bacterium]|nr:malto-oligosyltrehalose trehalohydrolase [Thermomicrobiales bacterium]
MGHASPPWRPTLGAIVGPAGTAFRVWAPRPATVELVLRDAGGERVVRPRRAGEYWTATVAGVGHGARYGYRLDGAGPFPDPCSRAQPDGVHGLSAVIDPGRFEWRDGDWRPPAAAELTLYECHVGTLTPGGTFDAAIGQLPRLRDLGVTAIELLPVAAFAGRWGWGYDGVALFAPAATYGGPAGLRRFVDAAHRAGLAVVLDVVYNHFGPAGNYTGLYAERYLTDRHATPWGAALNFDGPGAAEVRRFYVENLLHWLHEYHVDGFRLDATHAIHDASPVHILAELAAAARAAARAGRAPYLIAETHENDPRYLRPLEEGGFGFDAVWADDFHHGVRTLLTGEREGYFAGYDGTAAQLARTIAQGFLYEGQADHSLGAPRGAPARDRPWRQFVYCLQNHDQVGNRALGDRLNLAVARADYLAASLLLLLLPQTPLIFQGQEFLATTPFLYFTDHEPALGRQVTAGRRREFAGFAAFRDPALRARIPDPQAPATFLRSKLRLDEAGYGLGRACADLYAALLRLRVADPVLRAARAAPRAEAPLMTLAVDQAILVEIAAGGGRRVIAANFGGAVELPSADALIPLVHTGEPRFGGDGRAPALRHGALALPAHHAAFLRVGSRE